MSVFIVEETNKVKHKTATGFKILLREAKFESFIPNVLGLGEIGQKSIPTQALAAVFDLEGFTNFCQQIDPQLAVPEYLQLFLNWLFKEIREGIKYEEIKTSDGVAMYSDLPFLAKFLGDGVLFLWNTEKLPEIGMCNIVVLLRQICDNYRRDFLRNIGDKIVNPPTKLRCGISRGVVYSVGDGQDFVAPCINMASRLQKLGKLSFCFSRRGMNYIDFMDEEVAQEFVVKKVSVRGIGNEELVCILKSEFKALTKEEKVFFSNP